MRGGGKNKERRRRAKFKKKKKKSDTFRKCEITSAGIRALYVDDDDALKEECPRVRQGGKWLCGSCEGVPGTPKINSEGFVKV